MQNLIIRCVALFCIYGMASPFVFTSNSFAQSSSNAIYDNNSKADFYRKKVNNGTVGIISGGIAGTYIRIATDLAAVLDDNSKYSLRVLPIAGKGGVGNIQDLLYLKGIDLAIVQSDILDHIERNQIFSNVRKRVNYVTNLYNAELHVIAKKEITDIRQLDGKTVNFWNKGSATDITGAILFESLGIKVKPIYVDQNKGLNKVKSGEIAANMLLVGKPSKAFASIQQSDGLHLLPIGFEGKLADIYLPSRFTASDYPGLVSGDGNISTIASSAVLAVYNWPVDHPRYQKVRNFINQFFSRFEEFRRAPRHKKWREVNLYSKIPGWKRFNAAESWLISKGKNQYSSKASQEFSKFLTSAGGQGREFSPKQRELLFQKFLEWQKKSQ